MTDIVERLRILDGKLRAIAADEIERLRQELALGATEIDRLRQELAAARADQR